MDYLREGIGLRAMAQRDPLVEYQRKGFDLFAAMMDGIKEESVGFIFNLEGRGGGGSRAVRSRAAGRVDAVRRRAGDPRQGPRRPAAPTAAAVQRADAGRWRRRHRRGGRLRDGRHRYDRRRRVRGERRATPRVRVALA